MRYGSRPSKNKLVPCMLIALILLGGFIWFVKKTDPSSSPAASTSKSDQEKTPKKQDQPIIDLQPAVDAWAANNPPAGGGSASVVVIDLANNKTIASLNPDKVYFAASIYKLYVAYEGYQKMANGPYKMDDTYLSGYSRGKCLDEMIRSSYSPCGEKMWAELGKEKLTEKLKTYGLKNTNMTGLQTTATDASIILQRLYENKDLAKEHANLLLESMKDQPDKYRVGLPSGFTKSTVYNKVGWNEDLEWHDTAIVTLPSGRSYVVSVLTRSIGRANIVELAKVIEAKLTE